MISFSDLPKYIKEAADRLISIKHLPIEFISVDDAVSGEKKYFVYFSDKEFNDHTKYGPAYKNFVVFRLIVLEDVLDFATNAIDLTAKIPSNVSDEIRLKLRLAYMILGAGQKNIFNAYRKFCTDPKKLTWANAIAEYKKIQYYYDKKDEALVEEWGFGDKEQESRQAIYQAIPILIKNKNCQITIKDIANNKFTGGIVFVDEDIRQLMEDRKSHGFRFLDYVPEFYVDIPYNFLTDKDNYVDIVAKIPNGINQKTKATLRIIYRVLEARTLGRAALFKTHPELKDYGN